jgi:hypothetical protein
MQRAEKQKKKRGVREWQHAETAKCFQNGGGRGVYSESYVLEGVAGVL